MEKSELMCLPFFAAYARPDDADYQYKVLYRLDLDVAGQREPITNAGVIGMINLSSWNLIYTTSSSESVKERETMRIPLSKILSLREISEESGKVLEVV